jgi:putative methionine-R-sulfoxide reductase with GAF domain
VSDVEAQPYAGALEALHRILNREAEADEVLRQAVVVLHERVPQFTWVGLCFAEGGDVVLGPWQGERGLGQHGVGVPVVYDGTQAATLRVESSGEPGHDETAFLERVAVLISAHCLVGWDTGGVPWPEVG